MGICLSLMKGNVIVFSVVIIWLMFLLYYIGLILIKCVIIFLNKGKVFGYIILFIIFSLILALIFSLILALIFSLILALIFSLILALIFSLILALIFSLILALIFSL